MDSRQDERYSARVAKGQRKLRRASERQTAPSGKERMAALKKPVSTQPKEIPDPLSGRQLKSTAIRLGLILLAVWLLGGLIAGIATSSTGRAIALGIPGIVTLALLGLVLWMVRQARKMRGMAGLLQNIDSAEDREAALEKLSAKANKKDAAAIFAKAQLELQEDPKKALATLEQINLAKVMAPVADEARAQRAMIHLMQGEVSLARQLADNIELKRHQDAKTRAMMGAVLGEAWARSGDAKKGLSTLELFDIDDDDYADLRPQLWRAYAYCYAYTGKAKDMRRVLRKLLEVDVRLLGGFMVKRTHPLLQKEVRKLMERSGQVPRKMQVQRRL
jgi:hypothetical protein